MKTGAHKRKSAANKLNLGFRRRAYTAYLTAVFWLKISILLAVVLFIISINIFSSLKTSLIDRFYTVSADAGFVLRKITIGGQKNVLSSDILAAIGADEGAPLFSIKIDNVKSRLESNPWVKLALVERRMPDTLYIFIVERQPIAIWQFQQKLYLIDEEGNRISGDNIEKFNQLYHVVGVDANIYARSLIDDLQRHPEIAKRLVSAVRYGGRRWNLNLEQDIVVKMPENGFSTAYDYLNSLNQKDKLFGQNHKILDLRDPEKYYFHTR